MLNILGIAASEEEDKDKPFAATFERLGVRLDLTMSSAGKVVVEPKPSRVQEIMNEISTIIDRVP